MQEQICCGCGLKSEQTDGPVHRYLESSSFCWKTYGEILSREYQDYEYMAVHSLTVDAYALQHPGQDSPPARNSANLHLASLYSYFVLGESISHLPRIKQVLTKQKAEFTWLEPPVQVSEITVADVKSARTASEHCELVKKWASYVFRSWEMHHPVIADLLFKVNS